MRNNKHATVVTLLERFKGYVRKVADANLEQGAAMIQCHRRLREISTRSRVSNGSPVRMKYVRIVRPFPKLVCALSIGGLDPGGGAGILADVRSFAAAGVFGCAAIAVVTAQSTAGLRRTWSLASERVLAQVDAAFEDQRVRAIKLGALGSASNVRAVAGWLERHPRVPVVLDPVLLPTRGTGRLLDRFALDLARKLLLPRASIVTANAPEATALTGLPVSSLSEARSAALALLEFGPGAVLVKGGHLTGRDATDVLAIGRRGSKPRILELRARRLPSAALHGTGCTLAALIAGGLAKGERLVEAVTWAKRVHHKAIGRAADVGGPMRVLMVSGGNAQGAFGVAMDGPVDDSDSPRQR